MKPPYRITDKTLKSVASISEKIGVIKSANLSKPQTELRKKNRIKTIQSSLEIEGNTLSISQVTDILENKHVIAPEKDIIEVKNAIKVYNQLHSFNPYSLKSLNDAHNILMKGLIESPGKLRTKSVGIIHGSKVAHIAPPGRMVKSLMNDLFNYLKNDTELHLIKSCVFHYEFEFIHPYMDGNGRMGRLWQTLILKELNPVFEYLPVESLVKDRQSDYYSALGKSDKSGKSTDFVEFMLEIIDESLKFLIETQRVTLTAQDRISLFKDIIKSRYFTRQDYLRHFKNISPATASRDLKFGVEKAVLKKSGDKRTTKYSYN